MMKKILAVLFCAASVLTISGCDNKANLSEIGSTENSEAGTDGSGTGKNKGKRPGDSTASDDTNSEIVYNADGSIDWDSVPYADEEDFEYIELGDAFQGYTVTITKYIGDKKVIKIPETIGDALVTDLGRGNNVGAFHQASDIYVKTPKSLGDIWGGFSYCENMTLDITESDDLWIERKSFSDCKNLKVNMPSACDMRISEEAFSNCTFDGSLTLPDNLTSINKNCFGDLSKGNCPSSIVYRGETYDPEQFDKLLEAVAAANYVDPRPFDDGELGHSTLKIYDPYGLGVCNLGGVPRTQSGTYTVPDNVRFIDDYAFIGCESLENIILHGNVSISEKSFEGYEGNITYRGKTYKASEFNIVEAAKEPSDLPLTDWDSVPYASASDFEYEVLGMFMSKFVSITKYKGTSKQVKIPETIDGIKVGSLFGEQDYEGVFTDKPDIEVLLPQDVSLKYAFTSCGGARLYLPDTGISKSVVSDVLEGEFSGNISVVYKGVVYDKEHVQDFYDAVNSHAGD